MRGTRSNNRLWRAWAPVVVASLVAAVAPLVVAATPAEAAGTVPLRALPALGSGQVRPTPVALSSALEAKRSADAVALYGSSTAPALGSRKTSIVSVGDSEISGEGVGNYVAGTNGPTNYCHRSNDAAILKTGFIVDQALNYACSGAQTQNLIPTAQGGGAVQYDDMNQGDSLAIKARTTRVGVILMVNGANDPDGISFGPSMSDCVQRRILLQGNCWPDYTDTARARSDAVQAHVTAGIASIRRTMREAGYLDTDYELVAMSYPSPISPDVEDNPNFPGWYDGGCLVYLKDAAFGRNKVVPMFAQAIQNAAAASPGVRYLDMSRLFHGHEACTEQPWVNGVVFQDGNILNLDAHNTQQSFHPNVLGAAKFASCLTQMYPMASSTVSCLDPASTNTAVAYAGQPTFQALVNQGNGLCLDAKGYDSRKGTRLWSYACTGGRNQGFWYDSTKKNVHIQLNHDRCIDIPNGSAVAGAVLRLWDCNNTAAQQFTVSGNQIKSVTNANLCVTFASGGQYVGQDATLQTCSTTTGWGQFTWQTSTTNIRELKTRGTGACLDLAGGGSNNGHAANDAKIGTWTCDGLPDQKWWFNPISGRFHDFDNLQYCLDDAGQAVANGRITVWECKAATAANEQWVWAADGSIRIQSNQTLTMTGPTALGGLVTTQTLKSPANLEQQWVVGANLPEQYGLNHDDFIGSLAN